MQATWVAIVAALSAGLAFAAEPVPDVASTAADREAVRRSPCRPRSSSSTTRAASWASRCVTESAWRIEVRNAKDQAANVKVQEMLPGDWEILKESKSHTQESVPAASWNVAVPAGGSTRLEYRVRVKG